MKLFVVKVIHQAYVFAGNKTEACQFHREIVETEDTCKIDAREVKKNLLGWSEECCVYHYGVEDLQLKDVLNNYARKHHPPRP